MTPTKQQIDARVQAAVENLRLGRTTEDDSGIEFKVDWPDPSAKARQLAGAANALRGDVLLYVVGIDDKTGAVSVPNRTEPQEWYAQVCKPFDQIPPELLWTQTVFVGADSESVTVLVFATDQFPYVINAGNRREVPLRRATGTESAHRSELVRMFEPTLRLPPMSFTEAKVSFDWEEQSYAVKGADPPVRTLVLALRMRLDARVLVEHFAVSHPLTLPIRNMRSRLICGDVEFRPDVSVVHLGDSGMPIVLGWGEAPPPSPVPPQFGVYARDGHVIATVPGEFTINSHHEESREAPSEALSDTYDAVRAAQSMRLDLALGAIGSEKTVKLSAGLLRTGGPANLRKRTPALAEADLGTFELLPIDTDPWE